MINPEFKFNQPDPMEKAKSLDKKIGNIVGHIIAWALMLFMLGLIIGGIIAIVGAIKGNPTQPVEGKQIVYQLNDTRLVTCVKDGGALSCDWAHVSGADK